MNTKQHDVRLRIAQTIASWSARGIPVTNEELEFSFAMADEFGDDAVWQQL